MELVEAWHDSIDFIKDVTGHTRLTGDQLVELHTAITMDPEVEWLRPSCIPRMDVQTPPLAE